MGPLVAPAPPSLRGAGSGRSAAGMYQGLVDVPPDPLTQGRLICLCEASRRFRDLPLTRVTSDARAFLALSVSVKMISGSSKEPL